MSSRLCSMPPELLGEIFSHLTQLDPDSPFSLRGVCRTFYNVIRRTPKIWTHLKLDVSPDSVYHCLAKSEVWFSMAGDCKVWIEAELKCSQTTKDAGGQQDNHNSASWQDLPCHLSVYASRICSLSIRSATADEAQIFISSVYAAPPRSAKGHPLQSLSLITTSEAVSLRQSRSKAMSPVSLPTFPHLRQLTLTNHLLPYLSVPNTQNLQELSLTYPLRFAPLSIFDLRHALKSCSQLCCLELEARITDAPNSSLFPSLEEGDNDQDISQSSSQSSSLISLPNLTHLQLRINNLPLLLGDLLMQNLDTLKIEDLDGKRARADAETGAMLRQLLVRMELPSEHKQKQGQGLRSLELVGVAVPSIMPHFGGIGSSSASTNSSASDSFGTWSWCFHRMRSLQELRISKVNVKSILALVIGTSAAPRSLLTAVQDERQDDRIALPSLQLLVVALSPSASSFHAPAFLKLALQRPNINVQMDVVPEPPPMVGDFLAHYLS